MFDAALYLKLFSALGFLLGGSMFLYKNKKNKMKNGWLHGILLILAVIYDHHHTGVMEDFMDIQQEFRKYINAVMHLHMTEKFCLEVIIVKGDVKYIRELSEKIMRLKGVEHVK